MRITPTQNNFSAGEWAPSLYGRVDLGKYNSACRTMLNWLVHMHGGATTRSGTYYVGEVTDSTHSARFIPFQFSATDNYVLVFGDYSMQVVKGEGFVTGGTLPLTTPYAAEDLAGLKFTQTADTMYLTHRDYVPYKLTRTADDTWAITMVTYGPTQNPISALASTGGTDDKYEVSAVSDSGEESFAIGPVSASDSQTLSWTAPTGDAPAYYSIYKDDGGASGFYGWVADVTGTSWVVQNITPDMQAMPIEPSLFPDDVGNPGTCAFFEQRMVYGGSDDLPQTIWGSRIGFYDNFNSSHAINDDEPYEFTLDSRQLNSILWLLPLDRLLIGTAGNEWRMDGGSASDTITPTSVNVRVQSQWGSADIQPLVVGDTVLYVQYGGKNIRELAYSLESDRYVGRDLTILSPHLFEGRSIKEWCHQRTPDSVIWVVCDDGTLLGLTYLKEQDVWAWHRHETDGTYESCGVVPDGDGNDVLYLLVNRTIGGADKRYVETMQTREREDIRLAWSLDCARQANTPLTLTGFSFATKAFTAISHGLIDDDYVKLYDLEGQLGDLEGVILKVVKVDDNQFTVTHKVGLSWIAYTEDEWVEMEATDYDGTGIVRKLFTSVSGLSHLEGCTVTALADGFVCEDLTVASGAVTLPIQAGIATVGLPYTCDLETLDFIVANQTQTVADKPRRVVAVRVRLDASRSLQIGPDEETMLDVPFRTTESLDKPIEFFSGLKLISLLPSGDKDASRVFMRVDVPVPTTILSIVPRIDVGGE